MLKGDRLRVLATPKRDLLEIKPLPPVQHNHSHNQMSTGYQRCILTFKGSLKVVINEAEKLVPPEALGSREILFSERVAYRDLQ